MSNIKLIPKGLLGWFNKLRDGFINSTMTAAIASFPQFNQK